MTESLPPLAELLPQRGSMRLLSQLLDHGPEGTRCAVDPGAGVLFADDRGRVPVWAALEAMAQCAAVDGALRMREAGIAPPGPGLLLGSRRLRFRGQWLEPERGLVASARRASGGGRRFAFDCQLADAAGGAPLVEGRLNVLLTAAAGASEPGGSGV